LNSSNNINGHDPLRSKATTSVQPFNIDAKRIIYWALKYWYLVALSLVIALMVAFFETRYAVRIYPVSASILIKEKDETTSEGKLLYNNPLVSGFRNYLNELYLIKSHPFIESTLDELNFEVAFYKEGNVLTTEAYQLPFTAKVLSSNGLGSAACKFKLLNNQQFELSEIEESSQGRGKVFSFNDTISFAGVRMIFTFSGKNPENARVGEAFVFTYTDPSRLVGSYVSRLQTSWAEEGAGVINLSINGSTPAKEIDFLKGLITQYQLNDLQKKNLAASRTIDFISNQLVGISDSLQSVERQLQRFKDKNVMTDLSSEAQRLYDKLEVIESQRAELIIRNNYYKYLENYLKQGENLEHVILPSSVGIEDQILTGLTSKLIDLQMQLKMNTRTENPLFVDIRRKIDEIRKDIIESVQNQKSTDGIRREYLDQQVGDIQKRLNHLPTAERQLVSIQRNYSLLENLYIFLLQKRAEAGISKASTTTDIIVVNPPMISGEPIYPQPLRNYVIAIVLGLGIPLLAFVLMQVFNTKIQSREDVEKVSTIPFIGGVGHKSAENNLEVLTSPKTPLAESFRALRSNLNYFLGNKDKAVILVTSSISGEGKTFTSINLASVINLAGKKTLIVGADLRKPKLYEDFGLHNDLGLSTYLAGINTFREVVQQTSFPGLDLVSAGPIPPNPAELLLTNRLDEFVNQAKETYDFVIIDSPPIAIVTDAFAITRLVDHTLFLVRQNYTPRDLLRTTQDFYLNGKLKQISLVLNDIHRSGPGYGYGYGYSYGYGYGYGIGYGKASANGGYY
jgi:capsular exopolysaccharide synthesis family protein